MMYYVQLDGNFYHNFPRTLSVSIIYCWLYHVRQVLEQSGGITQPRDRIFAKPCVQCTPEQHILISKLSFQDWVLSSLLPNFTRRRTHPISHSVWCLTCFFVSALAGKNAWMEAVFPQLQQRFGFYDREDRRLFCLAGREFYRSLVSWGYTSGDRERFIATFEEAAAAGEDGEAGLALSTAPYQELLRCCRAYHSAGTIPQNQEL